MKVITQPLYDLIQMNTRNAFGTTNKGRFIQSSLGNPGNFEAVVYQVGNKLVHYYRDNSNPEMLNWIGPTAIISHNASSSGAIIQSDLGKPGNPGNFEVLVLEGNKVVHYYRDNSNYQWVGPTATVSDQATGAPAFIQSDFAGSSESSGNFEAVILEGNNLFH